MKTIEPVKVWYNGQEVDANILNSTSNDNLIDSAQFNYQLCIQSLPPATPYNTTVLASGVLTMTGDAYQNWTTNDYAYDWVASQLNLTITGEYIPPVPPNPTE